MDNLRKVVNLGEFEQLFKTPHQTIKRHLEVLTENKILKMDKKEKFLFYSLNLENPLVYEYLSICEKEKLFKLLENPLFSRLYTSLSPYFNNASILIFGSAADKKTFSDIDLLIISKTNDILKEIKNFEAAYNVKIHALITSEKDITGTLIKEVIKKHVILNNHDYYTELLYKKRNY